MGVLDYDQTPGNNTSINGIGIQGTSVVQNFDNALRQYMADMAAYVTRRTTKAANYTAVAADNHQLIEFTAAATLSLTAAATLGNGWTCMVRANGGDVVIDPNSSETINGAATLTLKDGNGLVVLCNGTAFFTMGTLLPNDESKARLNLGLVLTTSATDTTAGRVFKVGDNLNYHRLRDYENYYSSSDNRNIDTVTAGDVGLYSTANPGSWPTGAPSFLWVTTQATYNSDAVVQTAVNYSPSAGDEPQSWFRIRSNSGTWGAWRKIYNQGSIVGSVSQSGGVPTGAIIEQGSNSNGGYTRWADGTQICTGTVTLTGGGTVTISGTWTYPAAFSGTPRCSQHPTGAPPGGTRERTYWSTAPGTTSWDPQQSMNTTFPSSTSEIVMVIAIGRWF
ncbi:hypothetical protein [Nitratireductor sp. CH_MIT9313-5]|uniref:hypothetical protein n=1 Tax=Nitratireductor sp. CH_MIT9313-5 TaxID=3107764 RepID=UPI00300ACC11